MAAHASILAWRIPWTEEPGGARSVHGVAKSWTGPSKRASSHTSPRRRSRAGACRPLLEPILMLMRNRSAAWSVYAESPPSVRSPPLRPQGEQDASSLTPPPFPPFQETPQDRQVRLARAWIRSRLLPVVSGVPEMLRLPFKSEAPVSPIPWAPAERHHWPSKPKGQGACLPGVGPRGWETALGARNSHFCRRKFALYLFSSVWVAHPGIMEFDFMESEGMAAHPSTLAWRIPWTEEPGGPQSVGSRLSGEQANPRARPPRRLVLYVFSWTRSFLVGVSCFFLPWLFCRYL